VTLLYTGGMYLNDAFDVNFDQQHRKERPIPRGEIRLSMVWKLALLWMTLGLASLFWIGNLTGLLGVALVVCILLYDLVHKLMTFSPLLMGACRFFVYVVAASIAGAVSGWSIWCGLALASYIVGLSFVARRESARSGAHGDRARAARTRHDVARSVCARVRHSRRHDARVVRDGLGATRRGSDSHLADAVRRMVEARGRDASRANAG
jgi:4-hydroxybenzoate polyprenyltransferase